MEKEFHKEIKSKSVYFSLKNRAATFKWSNGRL